MEVAVSNRVISRNGIGRFIAECEEGARETAKDAVQEGARLSKGFAPRGGKPDPRTIRLHASIDHRMISATSGEWFATARHALPQEFGAGAHPITGKLYFFWEAEGRFFEPNPFGETTVQHPGNPAQPYLRPAFQIVMSRITQIARANYP